MQFLKKIIVCNLKKTKVLQLKKQDSEISTNPKVYKFLKEIHVFARKNSSISVIKNPKLLQFNKKPKIFRFLKKVKFVFVRFSEI